MRKFITFEGPEGSGKTTQIDLLVQRLCESGFEVVQSREPGGTALGESVRNLLQHDVLDEPLSVRSELLLFAASRAQLVEHVIRPALADGKFVLCDRFTDSTLAYQGAARGENIDDLKRINDYAVCDSKPCLTFLLDLETKRGFERLSNRYSESGESHDRFEREGMEFHSKVRACYLSLAEQEPERFRVINADQDMNTIADQIWAHVKCVFDI